MIITNLVIEESVSSSKTNKNATMEDGMKEKNATKISPAPNIKKATLNIVICLCVISLMSLTAFASGTTGGGGDIWGKASEIMKDVYNKILGISTVAAIVTAAVALLLMNFSKSGKTVDESRSWLKRIIITWAILNSLGFIMAYISPLFQGGQWNG